MYNLSGILGSINVPFENPEKVLDVDAFSVNCKDMDPKRYQRYTGGETICTIAGVWGEH